MNIMMEIEYDGINYAGWQYQPDKLTVQGELERALAQLYQDKIKIIGASRTDAGVSAIGQIANFHTNTLRFNSLKKFLLSLNAVLPKDIYVKKVKAVNEDFNARYSAKAKIYQYKIIKHRSPLRRRFVWVLPFKLDIRKMTEAAKLFVKHKNYSIFCCLKTKEGRVNIKSITISKKKDEIFIKIEANRFLYKMVRRIVGALVDVGRGRATEDDIKKSLVSRKHRTLMCAPAIGLILKKVRY